MQLFDDNEVSAAGFSQRVRILLSDPLVLAVARFLTSKDFGVERTTNLVHQQGSSRDTSMT